MCSGMLVQREQVWDVHDFLESRVYQPQEDKWQVAKVTHEVSKHTKHSDDTSGSKCLKAEQSCETAEWHLGNIG